MSPNPGKAPAAVHVVLASPWAAFRAAAGPRGA